MNREVRLYCGDCGKVPYWESLDSGAPPRICDACMALRELISPWSKRTWSKPL